MKNIFVINLCLTTFFLASCQSEKYENTSLFFFKDFKISIKPDVTNFEFDEPLMKPLLFVKSDSLLIVQNIKTNKMLYIYNVNTRKKVGDFIWWGNGPNDLLRIKNLQLIESDLYITDSQQKSINKYDVNDIHQLTDNLVPIQKITIDDLFTHIAYTENGFVATTMNPKDKRLVFYNLKGDKIATIGEYPYYGKELTMREKIEGFISQIAICHQYKRIYLFGTSVDLIEIYDFQGILIKRLHGPEQLFPQLKEIRTTEGYSVIESLEKPKYAFFSPQIVNDEIYVSYSGQHLNMNEESPRINHILVFDLDCNPVRRYELSKSIVSFIVDPDTKLIYATCDEPDFHMVVFEP